MRVSASCECLAGRITISTSRPGAFKNRNIRSVENQSSLLQSRALATLLPKTTSSLILLDR
jgi:hypothetical protein